MAALQPSDPQRVGPYVLLGRLGSGGMGRVYLARSPGGRMVAVKVIRAALAEDTGFRHRFAREVAAARKVGGLFTAQVVDADVDGPVPWLVTAYVPGRPLSDAVDEQGPLPAPTVLALAAGLAEGLIAIHAAGVIHRDLKPSNVLLAQDGPRIIDFGISSAADATQLTGSGFMIGSPGFMSPEQAEGLTVGPASDVFSLACVLTFAARGEGPFGSGDTAALLYRIVHGKPNLDRVPDKLRPLLKRSLSREAKRRPTAAEFLADLTGAYPSAADLTDWLPAHVLDPSAARPGTGAMPASASGASASGVSASAAFASGVAAEPGTSGDAVVELPTLTTNAPQKPQQYPEPQGYPGLAASAAQGGSGGAGQSPWWAAQQQPAATPADPVTPGTPAALATPGTPGTPVTPGTAVTPETPVTPVPAPGLPGTPGSYGPLPGRAPRRKGPPWLLPAAAGVAVAGAVIAVLVVVLSPQSPGGSGPAASPTPTVGSLLVRQFQVGDCLTGANMQLDKNTPWPRLTTAVPCGQPHTAEVFYANNSFWPRNSPYPGDGAVDNDANAACDTAFQGYVGVPNADSIYSRTSIHPGAAGWANGDRALHCVAFYSTTANPAGVTLHASIKGTRK